MSRNIVTIFLYKEIILGRPDFSQLHHLQREKVVIEKCSNFSSYGFGVGTVGGMVGAGGVATVVICASSMH